MHLIKDEKTQLLCEGIMFIDETLLVFRSQYKQIKIQHEFWPVDIEFS